MKGRSVRIALLCALVIGPACTGGDDGGAASPATDDPATEVTATESVAPLELGPGQTAATVGTTFQYGGFLVTIGDVVYDDPGDRVLLGLRFRNISDGWNQVVPAGTLRVGSEEASILADRPVDVPPGFSVDVTVSAEPVFGEDGDPLTDGVVIWDRPDRNQPEIPLDGSAPKRSLPVTVPLDGWASIGKYSVHLLGGQLQAGYHNFNRQADVGQRVLRVDYDWYAATQDPVNGFFPAQHLTLVHPDGTVVEGYDSSTGVLPVSWTAGGGWIEFPVPDPPDGDYELLLSSISPLGFSTARPELIERVGIPLSIEEPEPEVPVIDRLPRPILATDEDGDREDLDLELEVGPVNVAGYLFEPTRLRWDADAAEAVLEGDATYLQTESAPSTGVLAITPQFLFGSVLVSRGQYFSGTPAGDATVPAGETKQITIEFLLVDDLDPDDIGLLIGPGDTQASSIPLTAGNDLPLHPPLPREATIAAPPTVAGDWTIQLLGYRVGLLQSTNPPPPGKLELELFFDVTISPEAQPKALGLSFRPAVQLFLSGADGYLQMPSGDSGLLLYEPGQTQRQSVTFHVPDSFSPGTIGLTLRGNDETADVFANEWVETTFRATLNGAPAAEAGGGL